MNTFVAKHNITLRFLYPVKAGELVHLTTLLKYVTNGTIDFAVTLVPLFYDLSETYPLLAYPLETIRWFIVLPCPQPLAYAEIYKIVITAHVFGALLIFSLLFSLIDTVIKHLFYTSHAEFDFVNILVNENIFRGIFGLSFLIRRRPVLSLKILYLFLMLLGLFVSNMYSAYFQTLFTSPPLQEEIQTFDDMRRTGLKLMVDRNEIKSIVDSFAFISNKTFQNILQLEDTGTFQRHRRDYDNTYGYTMPESLWPIFKAQQETYDSHIFCLAPSLQLFSGMSLGAPLAENSYLTAPLSMLILRVIETGLLAHWRTRTFLDLVESKQLFFKRPAQKQLFHDISVNDVQFPFYMLLGGLFGSSILFTLEIYTFKLRKSQKQRS
ncbi:uncharacterized protein LOC101460589 [Ceratitis capitata]|uniref:uncharacterized protein LOC101460589 n=1 Tax=Ceratitis capitata TaxID=7213 RepID=UPI000A0F8642|nr:uncharacterized protein LOC101460589 [Ceratitis capitata]